MVHGSKICGYWAPGGPTIVFFTKKYKILNPVTLALKQLHKLIHHGNILHS